LTLERPLTPHCWLCCCGQRWRRRRTPSRPRCWHCRRPSLRGSLLWPWRSAARMPRPHDALSGRIQGHRRSCAERLWLRQASQPFDMAGALSRRPWQAAVRATEMAAPRANLDLASHSIQSIGPSMSKPRERGFLSGTNEFGGVADCPRTKKL
jgi:hypothetical protein